MKRAPWMWLLAGPNGAGKTTTTRELLKGIDEVLNPDQIAQQLSPEDPPAAGLSAGREVIRRTARLLESRTSFARETTLAGRAIFDLVARAKSAGFRLGLIYIGLETADLAVARVRKRKSLGGHFVPARDVRRRYARSLVNLSGIAWLADRVLVFDNSSSKRPAVRMLELREGELVFRRGALPAWLMGSFGSLFAPGSIRSRHRR